MPYLPPNLLQETAFPLAYGKDLATQVRMTAELYRRQYTEIDYYQLKKAVTAVAAPGDLSGETGTTKFDTLYREAVDPTMTAWAQPHLSGDTVAANPEQFFPLQRIHTRVQRVTRELDLKKAGLVKVRRLTCFIPTLLLDEVGVTVTDGDKFFWHDDFYYVKAPDPVGWWKNTNVRVFVRFDAETRPDGS